MNPIRDEWRTDDGSVRLLLGDCLEILPTLESGSVDAVVTDPPYGLAFMGKRWDYDVPSVEVWAECLRVLKPGGHLLCFAGTRTQHRMACRIEDAGFEIRDMIAWVYGSGFPKSMDVSKAIDKMGGVSTPPGFAEWLRSEREAAGLTAKELCERGKFYKNVNHGGLVSNWEAGLGFPDAAQFNLLCDLLGLPFERREETKREILGWRTVAPGVAFSSEGPSELPITAPATDAARQWQGWGTALKPALETVTFASKPYTYQQEQGMILSSLIRLEARLWLLSPANAAENSSTSSQSEYGAACATAQWNAEEITSTRAVLCGRMDTSLFESAAITSLSIVSSWRRTLAESWSGGSTSTTETRSSTTTDLRTLKFSLSRITPESIITACSLPGGFSANASTAENHFNASLLLLQSIRTLSATEPAMSQEAESCRGAGVVPSLEPITVARKPLDGCTVAENVLTHGTGALNIDGCRIATTDTYSYPNGPGGNVNPTSLGARKDGTSSLRRETPVESHPLGRWPANLIHDGSEEVVGLFPQSKSTGGRTVRRSGGGNVGSGKLSEAEWSNEDPGYGDTGSAARFFYCAKASKADRDEGCEGMPFVTHQSGMGGAMPIDDDGNARDRFKAQSRNHHPTVKPTDLMRYLCRLVTPPGGVVLDPFAGSGSTGKGAVMEGFRFIGIEREAEYFEIAKARIAVKQKPLPLFAQTSFLEPVEATP